MSEITEVIKKALEAATPGPWESTNLGDVHITKDYRIVDGKHAAMWIADMCEDREDEEQIFADAWLIANAPTWLRTLLEENELLRQSKADVEHNRKLLSKEKQELIEENERLRKALAETSLTEKLLRADVEMFRTELDQVKKERDYLTSNEYQSIVNKEIDRLGAELAEKDKVLEWIRDAGTDYQSINKAREVLLRYKKGDTTDASKDA